jgi:hypothetical protein
LAIQLDLQDIQKRIIRDFGDESAEAILLLNEAIREVGFLNHPRIIRCILFLANGNIESLKQNIDVATFDPRDVMFRAEYSETDNWENAKQIRDFNKPFE